MTKPGIVLSGLMLASVSWAEPSTKVTVPIYAYDPTLGNIIGAALFMYPAENVFNTQPESPEYHEYYVVGSVGGKGDPAMALDANFLKKDVYQTLDLTLKTSASNFYSLEVESNEDDADTWIQDNNNLSLGAEGAVPVIGDIESFASVTWTWKDITDSERTLPDDTESHYTDFSAGVQWDTRNNLYNTTDGWFVRAGGSWAPEALATEKEWDSTTGLFTEGRIYFPLQYQSSTATRLMWASKEGNIWDHELGGGELLRGYEGGRFRADNFIAGQQEVRFPVWRFIKGVAFVEAAQFEYDGQDYSAATAGGGLRFGLPPDQTISIRVDLAVTDQGESNIYVNFNQAF